MGHDNIIYIYRVIVTSIAVCNQKARLCLFLLISSLYFKFLQTWIMFYLKYAETRRLDCVSGANKAVIALLSLLLLRMIYLDE